MDTFLGRESVDVDVDNDYSNDGNFLENDVIANPTDGQFAMIGGVMKQWDGYEWVEI